MLFPCCEGDGVICLIVGHIAWVTEDNKHGARVRLGECPNPETLKPEAEKSHLETGRRRSAASPLLCLYTPGYVGWRPPTLKVVTKLAPGCKQSITSLLAMTNGMHLSPNPSSLTKVPIVFVHHGIKGHKLLH